MNRQHAALAAWFLLLLVLAVAAPSFFAAGNLRDVLLSAAPVLVVSIGMTFVIVAGEIDISIGSQFAVCSVAAGSMAAARVPMPVVVLLTCAVGLCFGALNGAAVARLGVPSIVATLAMMVTVREALRLATGGAWVQNLPPNFQWLGLGQATGEAAILAIAFAAFAFFAWASRYLPGFRSIYATGSASEAARLSGIDTNALLLGVFALMGALTGLAAVLNSIRFSDVQSSAGAGLELKAIAAVVVGGASITGGRASLTGTLTGVALLASIGPALTYLGIGPFWEKAIEGGIILAAISGEAAAHRLVKHA